MSVKKEKFEECLPYMTVMDFIGIARMLQVVVTYHDAEGKQHIRKDFDKMTEQMIEAFHKLNRENQRSVLKHIRSVKKTNLQNKFVEKDVKKNEN